MFDAQPIYRHVFIAPWGIAFITCALVGYDGNMGWHILRFWDVWSNFQALSDMTDWGVVVCGVIASIVEGVRMMVFFANAYIKKRREEEERMRREQREKYKEWMILTLAEKYPEVSADELRQAVAKAELHEELFGDK